ncbi:conserved Plasmodium protein, unknown function [Plasmodium gallinaceum]|uniref:Uncharacterized protein n=1 Tax=Plasmodium gallinaceum TaxID=5849 RepID=A0A1J1GMQ0_PLAGA|nr:conserved Plasmodium protein, unknown function [Plasmodium gallinaceum]CRG93644.1 conserved Plasmodium protein, unknown function [Plasmodium gallinaceum]
MNLDIYDNEKCLSLNGINKMVDDVYNDNLNFLLKKNKNELEKREIDQFSFKIEALLISLEEETKILHKEKDEIKKIFQNIAIQLKNVKKSIKKAEQYMGKNLNEGIIENSYKIFEDIKKDIDNL